MARRATQTVFGEGSSEAVVVLVGEQPGDREDREGVKVTRDRGQFLESDVTPLAIPTVH